MGDLGKCHWHTLERQCQRLAWAPIMTPETSLSVPASGQSSKLPDFKQQQQFNGIFHYTHPEKKVLVPYAVGCHLLHAALTECCSVTGCRALTPQSNSQDTCPEKDPTNKQGDSLRFLKIFTQGYVY